ncbi:MAG TPA: hypothetical protein DEV93_03510 [Chloroflexi bacterium]|nr:hypothetical protein [Chloroflexota bacterium]
MDISQALVAKSDQLNASDLTGSPIVATIKDVRKGDAAKPVIVDLEGMDGRPWKPSKGMLRVIAHAWGTESDKWIGRLVKLANNPEVIYAGRKGWWRRSHRNVTHRRCTSPSPCGSVRRRSSSTTVCGPG